MIEAMCWGAGDLVHVPGFIMSLHIDSRAINIDNRAVISLTELSQM